jgi:hypothetical protein
MEDVRGGRVGCEEVACCTGVKDGPMFDGVGIGVDCLQQDGGCKCIVVGGV